MIPYKRFSPIRSNPRPEAFRRSANARLNCFAFPNSRAYRFPDRTHHQRRTIAGPKILEHMVDTVLQFEGDRHHLYRILRSVKKPFGSTAELGIYEMQSSGLREVSNPFGGAHRTTRRVAERSRDRRDDGGRSPLLIETQALVSWRCTARPSVLRRDSIFVVSACCWPYSEKRCGFRLGAKDVFLNLAGGIRVEEDPAIDLAVICAILFPTKIAITPKICFAAEVGPGGEIRRWLASEQRSAKPRSSASKQIIISKNTIKKGLEPIPLQRHPHSCCIESGRGLFAAFFG